MLKGEPISRGISLYQPPFEEFQVLRVDVEQPGTISLPAQKSPMMLLGLESTGTHSLQVWPITLPQRVLLPTSVQNACCLIGCSKA